VAKYVAVYSHRHGMDLLHFSSQVPLEELDADKVARRLKVDWEPDREEYMDFFAVDDLDFPDIDKKPRKKKEDRSNG